jgi:hypothetical protein
MARVNVVMEFDFDGFDDLTLKEKIEAIEVVLDSGAESTCSYITVDSIMVEEEQL